MPVWYNVIILVKCKVFSAIRSLSMHFILRCSAPYDYSDSFFLQILRCSAPKKQPQSGEIFVESAYWVILGGAAHRNIKRLSFSASPNYWKPHKRFPYMRYNLLHHKLWPYAPHLNQDNKLQVFCKEVALLLPWQYLIYQWLERKKMLKIRWTFS